MGPLVHTRALSEGGSMRTLGCAWELMEDGVEESVKGIGGALTARVPREDSANELRRRRLGSTMPDVDSPRWF